MNDLAAGKITAFPTISSAQNSTMPHASFMSLQRCQPLTAPRHGDDRVWLQLSMDASGWWGLAVILLGSRGKAASRGPYGPDPLPAHKLKQHPALVPAGGRLQKVLGLMHLVTVRPWHCSILASSFDMYACGGAQAGLGLSSMRCAPCDRCLMGVSMQSCVRHQMEQQHGVSLAHWTLH